MWSTEPLNPQPTPDPEPTPSGSGMGFVVPYLGLATEKKYELEYIDNEDGTYSFKPASTSADYDIKFDDKEFTETLDEETGAWTVSVTRIGRHSFSVFYVDETGTEIGFGQITWTASETI